VPQKPRRNSTSGVPRTTDHNPNGEPYTFEKHVPRIYGGKGLANVWFRDHFA
jgi:hypothetical protein